MNRLRKSAACAVALSMIWARPSGPALAQTVRLGPEAVPEARIGGLGAPAAQPLDLSAAVLSLTSSLNAGALVTPAALTAELEARARPEAPRAEAAAAQAVLAALADPRRRAELAATLEAADARTRSDSGRRAMYAFSEFVRRFPELELQDAALKAAVGLGLDRASLDSLFDAARLEVKDAVAAPEANGHAARELSPFDRPSAPAPRKSPPAPKQPAGLPSISGFLLTAWRALAGWPAPRPDPTRAQIRDRDPRSPVQVRAGLVALSPDYLARAAADGSSDERLKDLLLFLEEVAMPTREPKFSHEEMYRLFAQNETLYAKGPPAAEPVLKSFWTPKSQIIGVLEKDGEIIVFAHKSYDQFVRSGLPKAFRGKPIVVVDTERPGSIVDGEWFRAHKENFYADKPVVLLTGGTSGLGLALAQRLVTMDYRVVLTGRGQSLSRLKDAGIEESDKLLILPLDITSAQDREGVVRSVTERWGGVDILINNASITQRGSIEDTSIDSARVQMETDYLGPRELTRGVLPLMRLKGRGRIINVSSIAGQVAMPMMESYSAAKHALDGHTEALMKEAAPFGIKVSLAQVSILPTEGIEKIQDVGERSGAGAPYAKPTQNVAHFSRWAAGQTDATADSVAAGILATLADKNPPFLVRPSWDGRLFLAAKDILPRFLFDRMVRNTLPNYQNWSQIDPSGVNPGRTTGLISALQQGVEFARNFIGDMQGRARAVTEDPRAVEERHKRAGVHKDYVPPQNHVTVKLKGRLLVRTSVGEFFDLWGSWIERGHGSVNDRQYADLAVKYRRWAAHMPLLRYLPMTSDDVFTASIVDGKMQFMLEKTTNKLAWVIPNAVLDWTYRRKRELTASNAFEKAIDDYRGNLPAVQAYYQDFFNPKRLNPKSRALVRFTVTEADHLPEPSPSEREFEHKISLPFGLPVPRAFLTSNEN